MKKYLIILLLLLLLPAISLAAPDVTGLNDVRVDGGSLVVTGTGFGANGPTIKLFDNFESGTNGALINIGASSATVGQWDRIAAEAGAGGNQPVYDNVFSVSGSQAFKADFVAYSSSGAYIDDIDTTDLFLSYWVYLPATSKFPCDEGGGSCNWKITWIHGYQDPGDDDLVLPVGLADSVNEPYTEWNISCNDCFSSPAWFDFSMDKGKWYRFSTWIHATDDGTSEQIFSIMSTDASTAIYDVEDWTGQIFKDVDSLFETFAFSGYARRCSTCDEVEPRLDDVYLATGANAKARVVIGNAATYATCTNLAISTVTAWADTEITTTIREGSLSGVVGKYLYVIHSDGTINADGYLIAAAEVVGTEGRSSSSGTLSELGW